ncbi:MAG: hypothetical protein WA137_01925 [Methanothrix sp.]
MNLDDNRKYSCLKLSTVSDVKELIRLVLEEICNDGKSVEMSGRVCNLLQVWLKGHEMSKIEDLEKRLEVLEDRP